MSAVPRSSPWGAIEKYEVICKSVFVIRAKDGGGIMVRKNAGDFLSAEARKIALNQGNYLCFNIGNDEAVVLRELIDKKMWDSWTANQPVFVDLINKTLKIHHPEYWEARAKTIAAEKKPSTLNERLNAGKAKAAAHNAPDKTPDTPRKAKNKTEL